MVLNGFKTNTFSKTILWPVLTLEKLYNIRVPTYEICLTQYNIITLYASKKHRRGTGTAVILSSSSTNSVTKWLQVTRGFTEQMLYTLCNYHTFMLKYNILHFWHINSPHWITLFNIHHRVDEPEWYCSDIGTPVISKCY